MCIRDSSNSVEAGLYEIIDRARRGQFKIFRGQPDLMDEWRQYHRDEKGNIVKVRDDILDAIRYGVMMRRFAVKAGSVGQTQKVYIPQPIKVIGGR